MSARMWRTVRVMISSTFRDMQAERDLLVRVVFPALRQRLERHRVNLIDIDLRWGVTKEQAENDQVIDLCLSQVDETRPFFIGLLGERYGWIPARIPPEVTAKHQWLSAHEGASVTELEFRYGAGQMDARPDSHALFFLRDPGALAEIPDDVRDAIYEETDPNRKEKLAALKHWVRNSERTVIDYFATWDAGTLDRVSRSTGRLSGLEYLGDEMIDLMWEGLRAELHLSDVTPVMADDEWMEEEDAHERFIESRLSTHVDRQAIQEALFSFAEGTEQRPCLLVGPSGSGKSAALAKFVSGYRQRYPADLVLAHFVGASPRSDDIRALLMRFCAQLRANLENSALLPTELPGLIRAFRDDLVLTAHRGARLLVVIDALDQLDTSGAADHLDWLPDEVPRNVRVLVSQIDHDATALIDAWRRKPHQRVQIAGLERDEQLAIIRAVPLLWAKTLDQRQIQLLLENPATVMPLVLLVALEELRGFGSFEALDKRIASLPRGEDAPVELFGQVIDRLEAEFEGDLVKWVLMSIAAARRGLSESNLLDLVGSAPGLNNDTGAPRRDRAKDQKDLFVLLRQLRPYILRRGNLIGFYHRALDAAVRRRYYVNDGDLRPLGNRGLFLTSDSRFVVHRHLAAYFHRQSLVYSSEDDKYSYDPKVPPLFNWQLIDELPWHLAQSRDWDALVSLLCKPPFFNLAYERDRESLVAYWRMAEAASSHRMLEAYGPLLQDPSSHAHALTAGTLCDLLYRSGYYRAAWEWVRQLVPLYRQRGDKASLQRFLGQEAMLSWLLGGSSQDALTLLAERETLCRELKLDDALAETLGNRASIQLSLRDGDGATRLVSDLEELSDTRVGLQGMQHALALRSSVLLDGGDADGALQLLHQEERLCRDLGLYLELGVCLERQAETEHRRGNDAKAGDLYLECERLCRQCGDRYGLSRSLHAQAQAAAKSDDLIRARRLLEESESIRRDMGDERTLTSTLALKSIVAARCGDVAENVRTLQELAQLQRNLGEDRERSSTLQRLGETLLDSADIAGALVVYREREQVCRNLEDEAEAVGCVVNQALLLGGLGQEEQALSMLIEQEEHARHASLLPALQACIGGRAALLLQRGALQEAFTLLLEEERLCRALGNRQGLLLCLEEQQRIAERQSDEALSRAIHEKLDAAR